MNKASIRSGLFAVVAVYMMKIAYDLYKARTDTDTTMTPAARTVFIVFFALAGIVLLVSAAVIWHRGRKEEQRERDEDEASLK